MRPQAPNLCQNPQMTCPGSRHVCVGGRIAQAWAVSLKSVPTASEGILASLTHQKHLSASATPMPIITTHGSSVLRVQN